MSSSVRRAVESKSNRSCNRHLRPVDATTDGGPDQATEREREREREQQAADAGWREIIVAVGRCLPASVGSLHTAGRGQ